MISHYYLQRTETRNGRHRAAAAAYATEGVALAATWAGWATWSQPPRPPALFANVVPDKKRRSAHEPARPADRRGSSAHPG